MATQYNTIKVPSIPVPQTSLESLQRTCEAMKQILDRVMEANPELAEKLPATLLDAPKDGVKYVRQNGLWVPA